MTIENAPEGVGSVENEVYHCFLILRPSSDTEERGDSIILTDYNIILLFIDIEIIILWEKCSSM